MNTRKVHSVAWLGVAALLSFADGLRGQSSARYFYDDAGQIFRALDGSSNLLEYVYDASGNIVEIRRSFLVASAVAILNVSPLSGQPGDIITIFGQNFSLTAGNNVVTFNGVPANVIAATATQLTVLVPVGSVTGSVGLTVGGQTVNSGSLVFRGVQPPSITSMVPDGGVVGRTINLAVSGDNLDGSTFSTNPAGSIQFTPITTTASATGPAMINGPVGQYAVIATTSGGSTSATLTSVNRFIVMDTSGEGATIPVTILNKAAPPVGTADPTAVSNESSSKVVAVLNTSPPPAGTADPTAVANEADAGPATVFNPSGPKPPTGQAPSGPTTERQIEPKAVTAVRLGSPDNPTSLLRGQTASVLVAAPPGVDAREVQVLVNGIPFENGQSLPFETLLLAPAGIDRLEIGAVIRDGAGAATQLPTQTMEVLPDPETVVSGRLTDESGRPVVGRRVTLELEGLLAEFFDFDRALTALPELEGQTPVRTGYLSGLNLKNPQRVFGLDPLGLGLAPDYALRARGELLIDAEGEYTFFVRSHAGTRLAIDGKVVVEAGPAAAEVSEAQGVVKLTAGRHRLEVTHYEAVGAPVLDVTWSVDGGERQAIAPRYLLSRDDRRTVVTNDAGEYTFRGVPANVDRVQVRVDGGEAEAAIKPRPGDVTRMADITVSK